MGNPNLALSDIHLFRKLKDIIRDRHFSFTSALMRMGIAHVCDKTITTVRSQSCYFMQAAELWLRREATL
jgi:hypothetical protein